jgi:phage terminase large subunit
MATAVAEIDPAYRYAQAARAAGCPQDQLRNFIQAGIVLQPQQLAASAAARECDRPDGPTEVAYGGARGGGKSHWGIAQVLCDDCARVPELKWLYLRKVGKAGREAIQDLRREVLHSTPHDYRVQEGVLIRKDNGSRVVLGHFQSEKDIDNYLGLQYDGVLVEEATQLSLRKIRDIGTCVRSSKPGWRPRKYYTTNPGNIGHAWFKARFIDPARYGRESATRFIQATVRDNAFVNAEYRGELETLTGWQRRAWLDGDWDIAAGQFFTTWRNDVHVREFTVSPHWRKGGSFDYGFTHFTGAHLLAEDGDGDLYIFDEHGERGWLPQRHAPAIHAMLGRHGLTVRDLRTFAAGLDVFDKGKDKDGYTIADTYKELGITLDRANVDRINGAGEILKRLGDVEAGIRPRLFIHPRCARLIETIPLLQHDPHRPEDVLKVDCDDDGNGGDDFYDSARYGVMAFWQQRAGRPVAGGQRPLVSSYRPR